MKSSTIAMGRAWKEGPQCTCRELSPCSCRGNLGTPSRDGLQLSHVEPQSGLMENGKEREVLGLLLGAGCVHLIKLSHGKRQGHSRELVWE